MGVLNGFVGLFKRSGVAAKADAAAPSSTRLGGTQVLGWGAANSALSIATVYRCVELLSDSVANLPMQYMRFKNGIFTEDTNSRLYYLLTVQPDECKSAFDFWKEAVTELLLDGNAYIVPVFNSASMDVDRLVLCSRGSVMHDVYQDVYTVHDTINGVSGTYAENEILHIKGHTRDGKNGISVLTFAQMNLNIAAAGDYETRNRFINGGNVRGIVSNERGTVGFGEYQDKELEKTAENIDGRFQSGERIVSLPGQVDFKQISLSSTDMQFLESRKFTVREICRFFGVHPSFVFDDTSNNYKSAEMANVAFLINTLNPLLRKIENEFLRKLVAPSLSTKRKFQFDRRGLYACDLDSRVKYQAQTIAAGLYTVNEWRKEENKIPVEGGDTVLVSANLRGITDSGAVVPGKNDDEKKNEKEQDQDDEK